MTTEADVALKAEFLPAVPLEQLKESPLNPRKRFDAEGMKELEASIREKGVLTPLLARRNGKGFEIAAGHRRSRAARAAGLAAVPVVVRDMTDAEFLEVLVIENDQREDVHPLEEAGGYQALLKTAGYDVAKIAARVGRSVKYVYDRLKLLQLVPEAQKLFLEDRFTAGHAILLARLGQKDQERAIQVDEGYCAGIFAQDSAELFDDGPLEPPSDQYADVKPVSVREFQDWIQREVKFDRENIDPILFPETAEAVATVKARSGKIIAITREHLASDAVRKAGGERIFGEQAWKRADGLPEKGWDGGEKPSKQCHHSQLAVVVCGPGQGEAFAVCINKEKCATHWSAWQKERDKRRRELAEPGGAVRAKERQMQEERQRKDAAAKEAAARKLWTQAVPQLREAVAGVIRGAKVSAHGLVADLVLGDGRPREKEPLIPRGKTAEDLLRHLAFMAAARDLESDWDWSRKRSTSELQAMGIDVKKILAAAQQRVQTSAPAEKRAHAKKKGRA